jgi:hypothetical protein
MILTPKPAEPIAWLLSRNDAAGTERTVIVCHDPLVAHRGLPRISAGGLSNDALMHADSNSLRPVYICKSAQVMSLGGSIPGRHVVPNAS